MKYTLLSYTFHPVLSSRATSSILHILLRARRRTAKSLVWSSMWWPLILQWDISCTAVLLLNIWAVGKWLSEAANWADDVLVGVHGEWEDWDEAEGKPVPALLDVGGVVTAVVALALKQVSTCDVVVIVEAKMTYR